MQAGIPQRTFCLINSLEAPQLVTIFPIQRLTCLPAILHALAACTRESRFFGASWIVATIELAFQVLLCRAEIVGYFWMVNSVQDPEQPLHLYLLYPIKLAESIAALKRFGFLGERAADCCVDRCLAVIPLLGITPEEKVYD